MDTYAIYVLRVVEDEVVQVHRFGVDEPESADRFYLHMKLVHPEADVYLTDPQGMVVKARRKLAPPVAA
jgi:hypothetical protein